MKTFTSVLFTALTAAAVLAPSLANAATADAVPTVTVRYSDLDLRSDAGSAVLYARLVSAAHQVCPAADNRNLGALAAVRACERQAIANAVRDVNSPKLAAIYSARARRG
jgi:UrcA family protein